MSFQGPAVSVSNLTKVFPSKDGQVTAVDGISFEVSTGEIFGFLGPNGAGKTTTVEIVEGLQQPTSGTVSILGHNISTDLKTVKKLIGVQLQEQAYFKQLRLSEILKLFGTYYGVDADTDALLDSVELKEKRNALVKELSGGQAKRFSIAAALVNDPEILFLDEPTSGLDPQARRHLWDHVNEVRGSGKTVVLTTHYMEEAETLCDRVAILDKGSIQGLDSPINLIQGLDSAYHFRFSAPRAIERSRLEAFKEATGHTLEVRGGLHHYDITVGNSVDALGGFAKASSDFGVDVIDLRVEPATLEEVFLNLTGRALRD